MAVRAANFALLYLSLRPSNAFCKADVHGFGAANMVELEGAGMAPIATVYAAFSQLVVIQPLLYSLGSFVSLLVDQRPIGRVFQTYFPKFLGAHRVVRTMALLFSELLGSFWIAFLPSARGLPSCLWIGGSPSPRVFTTSFFLFFCSLSHVWSVP